MRVFLAQIIVILFCSLSVEAIRCLTCDNARSNEECLKKGKIVTCKENEDACHNEIRRDGRGLVIKKRCKQSRACVNNEIQNPRPAWVPTQCNMEVPHTVCRCCCFEDGCNFETYECPNDCGPVSPPKFGQIDCTFDARPTEIGSECAYSCADGYKLIGEGIARCIKLGGNSIFDSKPPVCIINSCQPEYKRIFNGQIECTDSNNHGSICTSKCDFGFRLVGKETITCNSDNKWSSERPICRSIRCRPKQTNIEFGQVHCSNYNVVGSICKYTCDDGYALDGQTWIKCKDDGDNDLNGKWSADPPKCVLSTPICEPIHIDPLFGEVVCSNDNFYGSVCQFQCDPGFGVEGSSRSTCGGDILNPNWDFPSPTCEPIFCLPNYVQIKNGGGNCTDNNSIGSFCKFLCDYNFVLEGSDTRICKDNFDGTASWSSDPPTCRALQCFPPLKAPENGVMNWCSDVEPTNVDEFCSFDCDEGYVLVGSQHIFCENYDDISARWADVEPVCRPIVCLPEHLFLENGVVSCSKKNHLKSICSFECDEGFNLRGSSQVSCVENSLERAYGKWDSSPPVCDPVTCSPRHVAPDFGTVSCSNDNFHGSVCTFECPREDMILIGSKTSICMDDEDGDDEGNWNNPAPICQKIDCGERPEIPENGNRVCSDGSDLGSVCEFGCHEYYRLVGSETSTCVKVNQNELQFDQPPPICIPLECEEQGPMKHGEYQCSRDNFITSKCEFSCNGTLGFELYPLSTSENLCVLNSDGTHGWSKPKPCCALPCPPYARMDLAIAMDSSSSVKTKNWQHQLDFTLNLINSFVMTPDGARMSVFRFNRDIDEVSEIRLSTVVDGDKRRFLELFAAIPYNGSGTKTGKALEHMYKKSFTTAYGDRPDVPNVALVLTDGVADDVPRVLEYSKLLRENNVLIYAVGIGMGKRGQKLLDQIAGDRERTATSDDFLGLQNILSDLSTMICPDPCDN